MAASKKEEVSGRKPGKQEEQQKEKEVCSWAVKLSVSFIYFSIRNTIIKKLYFSEKNSWREICERMISTLDILLSRTIQKDYNLFEKLKISARNCGFVNFPKFYKILIWFCRFLILLDILECIQLGNTFFNRV